MDPKSNISRSINSDNLITIVTSDNIGNTSAIDEKRRDTLRSIHRTREQLKLYQNESNYLNIIKYQGVLNRMETYVTDNPADKFRKEYPGYLDKLERMNKKLKAEEKSRAEMQKSKANIAIDLTGDDNTPLKNEGTTSTANTGDQIFSFNSCTSTSSATGQNLECRPVGSSRPSTGDGSKKLFTNESGRHSSPSNKARYPCIVDMDDLQSSVSSAFSAAQKKSFPVVNKQSPPAENALGASLPAPMKSPLKENAAVASLPPVHFDAVKIKEALNLLTKIEPEVIEYENSVRETIGLPPPADAKPKLSDFLEQIMNASSKLLSADVKPRRSVSPAPRPISPSPPLMSQPQPRSPSPRSISPLRVSQPHPVSAPCAVSAPCPVPASRPVPAPHSVPTPHPAPVAHPAPASRLAPASRPAPVARLAPLPRPVPRSHLLPTPCPVPRPVPAAHVPPVARAQVGIPSGYSTPPPTPNINEGYTTPPPTPNINGEPAEKPIRPPLAVKSNVPDRRLARSPESKGGGVRNKLAQEIMQIHRAGDDTKIQGSLKTLKSNLKSTGPPANAQTNENALSQQTAAIQPANKLPIPSLLTLKIPPGAEKAASRNQDAACQKPKASVTGRPVMAHHQPTNNVPQKYVPKFSHSQNNARKFEPSSRYNPGFKSSAFSVDRRPYSKSLAESQRKVVANDVDYTKRVKESTEFQSPLSNMYPETNSSSARPGNSHKQFPKSFKIPKVHNNFYRNVNADNSLDPRPKVSFKETQSKEVEENRVTADHKTSNSAPNSTTAMNSTANDSLLPATKKISKKRKRKRVMTRMTDDDENDAPNDDVGDLNDAKISTSTETETLVEDSQIQDNAIENIIIPDVVTSENTRVKKKPPTDDGGSSSEGESPVSKKSKPMVHDDENKTSKVAVTKSRIPTPPQKGTSTPQQHESSDVTDEMQVLEKSSDRTPVPAKSSEKIPVPTKSSDKIPVPAKSSEETQVPAKSNEKTPILAESSKKRPGPAKSSKKTPVPTGSSEKTPRPAKSLAKTPVSAKSFEETPVLAKSSDKTSEDVPQQPVVSKRKLSCSNDVTAKRKRVVSESKVEKELDEENSLSDAITKLDDAISDAGSLSPVVIEYDIDLDELEPTSTIANKKSVMQDESIVKDNSITSEAKSTFQEQKSDSSSLLQNLSKGEKRFNVSKQTLILKQSPTIPEQKCITPEPPSPIVEQKPPPAEPNEEADGDPTDEETYERLKSIPRLKSRIEECNLKGVRLYTYLMKKLSPEEFLLVQNVLNGSSKTVVSESTNASLNTEIENEKPSVDSRTTPSSPVPSVDESVAPTPSSLVPSVDESVAPTPSSPVPSVDESVAPTPSCSVSTPPKPDIDLSGSLVNATSAPPVKKSKVTSKSRKAAPKSRKASKRPKTSPAATKSCPKSEKTSSKSPKTSPKTALKASPKKSANVKRYTSELDRLHADIEKMQRTKNNIFRAVGPRTCRKQIPMINDVGQKVKSTVLPRNLVPKVPGEASFSSSSSDEDVFRPTSNKTVAKRKKNSHMFSSSSDDTEPNSNYEESSSVTRVKRTGRRSSRVEGNRSRSSSSKSTRQSRSRSKSHTHVEPDSSSSCSKVEETKPNEKCSSDAEMSERKSTPTSRRKDKNSKKPKLGANSVPDHVKESASLPEVKICLTRLEDTEYKRCVKMQQPVDTEATVTSNEDTLDSSFSEYDCSFTSDINEDFLTNSTDTAKKQRLTLKLKKKNTTQKKTSKLFPKKGKHNVLSANDRIKLLPDRNWLKDGGSSLQHVTIVIKLRQNKSHGHELLYECITGSCSIEEYNSLDAKMFAQHLSFAHGQVEWDGRCKLCDKISPRSDLIDAFAHLMEEHLIFIDESPFSWPISSQEPEANLVSFSREKVTLPKCIKDTTPKPSKDGSCSSPTTIILARDPPNNSPPAISENDFISKQLKTITTEDPPEVDSISTPNVKISSKEPVKSMQTTSFEDDSVSLLEEILTTKSAQKPLTITRIGTAQAKPPLKRAVAKKQITGRISRKTIAAKQLLQRTSIPEPSDDVLVTDSVTKKPSIPASQPFTDVPVMESVRNLSQSPAPVSSDEFPLIERVSNVSTMPAQKSSSASPVIESVTSVSLNSASKSSEDIPAKEYVAHVSPSASKLSDDIQVIKRVTKVSPIAVPKSSNKFPVMEHVSSVQPNSAIKPANDIPVIEHIASVLPTPPPESSNEFPVIERVTSVRPNSALISSSHIPVIENVPLTPASTGIAVSSQVGIIPEEESSQSTKPSISTEILIAKPTTSTTPPLPVQVEHVFSKSTISNVMPEPRPEATPAPERVDGHSVTRETNESIELPASTVEEKNAPNNDTDSTETDSDSSKPRIRVRRMSGDKLSGNSPIYVSENAGSSRASVRDVVTELEPTQSTQQCIIQGVKTLQQQNEIESPCYAINQANTINSSSPIASASSAPPGVTASSSPSSVSKQSVTESVQSVAATVSPASSAAVQSVPSGATDVNSAPNAMIESAPSGIAAISSTPSTVTQNVTSGAPSSSASSVTTLVRKQRTVEDVREEQMMNFFKCSACRFNACNASHFADHFNKVHKIKNKRNKKIDLTCLNCVYCRSPHETPESLIGHMYSAHRFSSYQCSCCNYRACRPVYVAWHWRAEHPNVEKKILVPDLEDNITLLRQKNVGEKKLSEVVPGYACAFGCPEFFTRSTYEFTEHMKQNHDQLTQMKCLKSKCSMVCLSLNKLLMHLSLEHSFNEYQCTYCELGFSTLEMAKVHLFKEHHSSYPKILRRACTVEDLSEGQIRTLDLDEPVENFRQYLKVVGENVTTAGEHWRNGNDDDPLSSSAHNSPLTDPTNNSAAPGGGVNFSKPRTTAKLTSKPNSATGGTARAKRAPITLMGLSGKDLYRCGMKDCAEAFDDFSTFKQHTITCDNARNATSTTCVHCKLAFLKNNKFFDHINLHGIPRYSCSLCDFKHTSVAKVKEHMRTHKVWKTTMVPTVSWKTNASSDNFVILPDPGKKSRGPSKAATKSPTAVTRRPHNVPAAPAPQPTPPPQITVVYSRKDVENQPPSSVFKEPIKCGLCVDYSSKVRTNLSNHMHLHDIGLVPTNKDIVNPVPQTEKTEQMFNKMTNHAAYSAKNDETKNIVETKIENSDANDRPIVPTFIPKTHRFRCGAEGCTYITQDSVGLKKHFETLHAELEKFCCPHCGFKTPLAKINIHFRYHNTKLFKCGYCHFLHYQSTRIEEHQEQKHPEKDVLVVKLRALETDENTEIGTRFQSLKTDENNASSLVRWRCNLCKYTPVAWENYMKSHCRTSHGVSDQYKCSMCSFSADEEETVASHLKNSHSGSSQIIVTIYKQINLEESLNVSNSSAISNMPPSMKRPNCGLPDVPVFSGPSVPSNISVRPRKEQLMEVQTNEEKTHSAANTDKVPSEEEQQDDRNNLLVSPYSAFEYRCPLCENFKTHAVRKMRDHIFAELKYSKFVCTECGKIGVSRQELEPHLVEERITHPRVNHDYFETLTEDRALEDRVQKALDHQTSLMKQMDQNPPIFEISDDEDDVVVNSSSRVSNSNSTRSSSRSPRSPALSGARCKTNIIQSPRGSPQWPSNPSVSPRTSPRNIASPMPCIINTSTVGRTSTATCPTCDTVFRTVAAVQAHIAYCSRQSSAAHQSVTISSAPNQSSSGATDARRQSSPEHQRTVSNNRASSESPSTPNEGRRQSVPQCQATTEINSTLIGSVNRLSDVTPVLSTDHTILKRTLNQSSSADSCHLRGESSEAMVEDGESGRCEKCGPATQPMSPHSLSVHRRRQHDLFTCIRCCGQFAGEDRLMNHIHSVNSLSSADEQNRECIPVATPNIRMLCKYCSYTACGNNYQTYVSLVRHIRSQHPGSVSVANRLEEGEIEVQVQSGKCRPLTSCEISLLQAQSNSNLLKDEGTDSVSTATAAERVPPVKRRRVAVKSTARPTASQPFRRVPSESSSESEPQCQS